MMEMKWGGTRGRQVPGLLHRGRQPPSLPSSSVPGDQSTLAACRLWGSGVKVTGRPLFPPSPEKALADDGEYSSRGECDSFRWGRLGFPANGPEPGMKIASKTPRIFGVPGSHSICALFPAYSPSLLSLSRFPQARRASGPSPAPTPRETAARALAACCRSGPAPALPRPSPPLSRAPPP